MAAFGDTIHDMRLSFALVLILTLTSAAIADERAADSDMAVARYYASKAEHFGTINRLKIVLTKYSSSAHAAEALARIAESYLVLGAAAEAQTAAAVLDRKFPGSPWSVRVNAALQSANLAPRENEQFWISRAFR